MSAKYIYLTPSLQLCSSVPSVPLANITAISIEMKTMPAPITSRVSPNHLQYRINIIGNYYYYYRKIFLIFSENIIKTLSGNIVLPAAALVYKGSCCMLVYLLTQLVYELRLNSERSNFVNIIKNNSK